MATLTIWSSDPDENPLVVTFVGEGQNGPDKIIDDSELTLLSPAGGEKLEAGSFQEVRWTGGEKIKSVKIEYSADNGSTYRTIAERAANIGVFPWRVPEEASGSCLVRISDAEGALTMPVVISFEFNFRISALPGDVPEGAEHFVFRAGVPDQKTQTYQVSEIAFAPDGLRGTENLLFNHAVWEVQGSEAFLGRWHRARIVYDMTQYTGSVWIDGEPILFSVPLQPNLNVHDRPEISLSRGASVPIGLWIDDVEVGFEDAGLLGKDPSKVESRRLFRDNFNRYESALFPLEGGWKAEDREVRQADRIKTESSVEGMTASKADVTGDGPARSEVDDRVYASSAKSFKLEGSAEEPSQAAKRFSMPERVPYCVSRDSFSIVPTGEATQTVKETVPAEDRNDGDKRQKRWDGVGTGGSQRRADRNDPASRRLAASRRASGSTRKGDKMMSGSPATGTFYIYAFDGRLLAEYDVNGQIVREYIYFAGMLVAEYRNQESRLLYYASDQINSTRIVTDNNGNVVYSAAHEPYGGTQKTWPSTYDPSPKFSGKERDDESGLDYFGARYYDHGLYRFLSADPAGPSESQKYDLVRWNLYAYCGNNPTGYVDPNGQSYLIFVKNQQLLYLFSKDGELIGCFPASNNAPKIFPYGYYSFHHHRYPDYPEGHPSDAIDYYGFFGFSANNDGSLGVHAGRFGYDGYWEDSWQYPTQGCIRTTPEGIATIWAVHFALHDELEFIIVTDEWEYREATSMSDETIKKLTKQMIRYMDGLEAINEMFSDYFFWYGPIPPGAQ
jgi:RHS repeat-associated protein